MKKNVLFIHGGGHGGYEADAKLAASLQAALGTSYEVYYPRMEVNETASDFGWPLQIGREMGVLRGEIILVAHSLGASLLLKYLSGEKIKKQIGGIFLIATPFWNGTEDWVQGLKLPRDFPDKLPKDVPIFFYHCEDDREIPFDHLLLYKQKLPAAGFREIAEGGHQLGYDLTPVAEDIKKAKKPILRS